MDFILFGVDQTKIKQSEKSSNYNEIEQNLISIKENLSFYQESFSSFVMNQTESSFTYLISFNRFDIKQKVSNLLFHETFYSFEVNQSTPVFSMCFIHFNIKIT